MAQMNPDQWIKLEHQRRAVMAQYACDNHAAAAFASLRMLASKLPQAPAVQADLMLVALALCEYRAALMAAERLMDLAGQQPAAVQAVTEVFLLCGFPEKALAAWQRLEKSPERHAAWLGLARLAERGGRMEDAAEWTARALAESPRDAATHVQAGRLARRRGHSDAAAKHLEPCAASGVPPAIRVSALYELGELRDASGDCAEAATAWREAKRCSEEAWPVETQRSRRIRELVLERNRRLVAGLTPDLVRRWRSCRGDGAPTMAVLAGHPRSGTTLLEQVLASHSAVTDVDEKDALACALRETLSPGCPDGPTLAALDDCDETKLAAMRRDYLRRLSMLGLTPGEGGVVLDKNPNFTDWLPFLLRPLPQLRLIVALRDPRDVLLSCFRLPVKPESGNAGWLCEAHAAEDYLSMMGVWECLRECLGDDSRWREVHYEELCTDFEKTARGVTAFLGLEWEGGQSAWQGARMGRHVASPSYESVRAPVHRGSIGRWRRYAEYLPELFAPFGSA